MKNVTVFKTAQVLESPKLGFNKLIIPLGNGIPGEYVEQDIVCLYTFLKAKGVIYKIDVFNGALLSYYRTSLETYKVSSEVDQYDNTINKYEIPIAVFAPSVNVGGGIYFHVTVGTTRIDLYDFNECFIGAYFGGDDVSSNTKDYGAVDLAQYAFLDVPRLTCIYNNSYGALESFKDHDEIVRIQLTATKVTGNINSLLNSARNGLTTVIFAYCTGIYGNIEDILDVMRTREDIKGQTLNWYFWQTAIKYRGNSLGTVSGASTIVFDNEGNYTVNGV